MAQPFKLSVVAPDRSVVEVETTSVVAPGLEGYFGVMAGHQPVISALRAGIIEFVAIDGMRHYIAIGGGFAEFSMNKMTVLADDASMASEIELAAVEHELDEARKALRGESSTMNAEQATQAIERAMARIKAAKKAS